MNISYCTSMRAFSQLAYMMQQRSMLQGETFFAYLGKYKTYVQHGLVLSSEVTCLVLAVQLQVKQAGLRCQCVTSEVRYLRYSPSLTSLIID